MVPMHEAARVPIQYTHRFSIVWCGERHMWQARTTWVSSCSLSKERVRCWTTTSAQLAYLYIKSVRCMHELI